MIGFIFCFFRGHSWEYLIAEERNLYRKCERCGKAQRMKKRQWKVRDSDYDFVTIEPEFLDKLQTIKVVK